MLTDLTIRKLGIQSRAYKRADGRGLYIHVFPTGAKLWRIAYRYGGRQKTHSLGAYPFVNLSEAREKLVEVKRLLAKGIDPAAEKRAERRRLVSGNSSFEAYANKFIGKRKIEGRSASTIEKYEWCLVSLPRHIHQSPVTCITAKDIHTVVAGITNAGALDKAKRCLSFIRNVLALAVAAGEMELNPAVQVRGAITSKPPRHHPGITSPVELGALLRNLDRTKMHEPLKMGFLLLAHTFVRPGELRFATWQEIDFKSRIWTIPAERMKMRRVHAVPLSRQVVSLLSSIADKTCPTAFILPGAKHDNRPLSENAFNQVLKRLGYAGIQSSHGFRTTASTLLNEQGFNADWIEKQLAHVHGDSIRAAYNAAEYEEGRRQMMQSWSDFLDRCSNTVTG